MSDQNTAAVAADSPGHDPVAAATHDQARHNALPGVSVPYDADHYPHLQPAAVNHNSPEAQAAEAARLNDRVNAERAVAGLLPLEPPVAPVAPEDVAADAAEDTPVAVPVKAPVREPAPEPAADGEFFKGLPRRA